MINHLVHRLPGGCEVESGGPEASAPRMNRAWGQPGWGGDPEPQVIHTAPPPSLMGSHPPSRVSPFPPILEDGRSSSLQSLPWV